MQWIVLITISHIGAKRENYCTEANEERSNERGSQNHSSPSDVLNGCDDKLKGASLNVADGRWRPLVAQLAFIVYGIILATDASVPTDSEIGMTPGQGYEEQKWISRQQIEMAGPQTREEREYCSTT